MYFSRSYLYSWEYTSFDHSVHVIAIHSHCLYESTHSICIYMILIKLLAFINRENINPNPLLLCFRTLQSIILLCWKIRITSCHCDMHPALFLIIRFLQHPFSIQNIIEWNLKKASFLFIQIYHLFAVKFLKI